MSVFGIFVVRIFPHSDLIRRYLGNPVKIRENTDQKNSKYGHFSRSCWGVSVILDIIQLTDETLTYKASTFVITAGRAKNTKFTCVSCR